MVQKASQPSVDELASTTVRPEGLLSADSKLGVEVTVQTQPPTNPASAKSIRRKSRGVSATVRPGTLTRVPNEAAGSGGNLHVQAAAESEPMIRIAGESTPTMARATGAASMNKFNPSIRSLNTINSDLPDTQMKFAPTSIYKVA